MAEGTRKGPQGLGAIAKTRDERSRGVSRWPTHAGLVAGGGIAIALIAHKVVTDHELNTGKQALLAKQRAVVATLGAEWTPLRDELERDVLDAASAGAPSQEY